MRVVLITVTLVLASCAPPAARPRPVDGPGSYYDHKSTEWSMRHCWERGGEVEFLTSPSGEVTGVRCHRETKP